MKIALVFPALLLLSLMCCAPAPLRPVSVEIRRDHALLEFDPHMNLYVAAIDGDKATLKGLDHFVLDPGVHTFTLKFRKRQTSSGRAIPNSTEFDLSIDAKAGRTYQIVFESHDEQTKWSAMVLDAATRTRVSSIITHED